MTTKLLKKKNKTEAEKRMVEAYYQSWGI